MNTVYHARDNKIYLFLQQNTCHMSRNTFITVICTVGSVIYECKKCGSNARQRKLLGRVLFIFHGTRKNPSLRFFSVKNPIAKLQLSIRKSLPREEPQQYFFISSNSRKIHLIHLFFHLFSHQNYTYLSCQ